MAAIILNVFQPSSGGDIAGIPARVTLSDLNTYSFRNTGIEHIIIIPSASVPAGSVTILGVPNGKGLDGQIIIPTTNSANTFAVQKLKTVNYNKSDGMVDISVSAGTNADIIIMRSL